MKAPGLDVVAPLLPIQYLRYLTLKFRGRATIETIIGQRQVPCAALWVQPAGQSGGELHCRLPSFVVTAPGFKAQVMVKSILFRNVVVVPNIYIAYARAIDGMYVIVKEAGRDRRIPITTGVTDGVVSVVTSRVPVGATLVAPRGG